MILTLLCLLLAGCKPVPLEAPPDPTDPTTDSGLATHTHGLPGIVTPTTEVLRLGTGTESTVCMGPNGRWMAAWRDGDTLLGAVHDADASLLASLTPDVATGIPGPPQLSWSGAEWHYAAHSDTAPRTQAYDLDGNPTAESTPLLLPSDELPVAIALDTDPNFEGHLIWSTGPALRHGRFGWPADLVQNPTETEPTLSDATFGAPTLHAGSDHYVAAWFESNDSETRLWTRRIGFDGQLLSPPLEVTAEPLALPDARPRIAMDPSGRFAVAWQAATGVTLRIIGWDDTPLTTEIPLDPTGTGRDVAVANHHDTLVAVWTEEVDGLRSVYAQSWLMTMGLAITEPVVLATGPAMGVEIDLTDVDHEGFGVLTWTDGADVWAQPFNVSHGN